MMVGGRGRAGGLIGLLGWERSGGPVGAGGLLEVGWLVG